jgi:hypothetical protein
MIELLRRRVFPRFAASRDVPQILGRPRTSPRNPAQQTARMM